MGAPVDITVCVHDLIIDGLNSGELLDCEGGPAAALAELLGDDYGGGLAAAAEGCFEMLYGCDPYTFVRHVANNTTASEPAGRVDV